MARNTIEVQAPPDAVWEVLADPRLYANWVVGASTTRWVDGDWPEPGAVLHHTQLLVINDTTEVIESDPPSRLLLEARARPLMVGPVDIRLESTVAGTHLVMDEWVTGGLLAAVPRAVTDRLLELRNREAVRRLRRLAEMGLRLRPAAAGAGV